MIILKRIEKNNVGKSLRFLENVYSPPLSKRIPNYNQYINKLENSAFNYGAFFKDEIVGFISFYANNTVSKEAYITQLVVKQAKQKMGIGKALIILCKEEAKNAGMETLRLEVRKNNGNAICFYKKMGFQFEDEKEESIYIRCQLK